MLKLKKSLQYIFNSKNYKFLIYLLIGLILVFLICGNYNLLEGITSRKLEESLNDTHDEVSRGENVINKKEIDSRNEESKYRNLTKKKTYRYRYHTKQNGTKNPRESNRKFFGRNEL